MIRVEKVSVKVRLLTLFLVVCFGAMGLWGIHDAGKSEKPVKSAPYQYYQYPVLPGTPGWSALNSHGDMILICQIPLPVLNNINTADLVETVLNYPLFLDMLAYNDIQTGFNEVAGDFNGLTELLNRQDAGIELLKRYRQMDPAKVRQGWSSDKQEKYIRDFFIIEMILAQKPIINGLNENEKLALLEESLKKFNAKVERRTVFGKFSLERSALIMGRVLERDQSFLSSDSAMNARVNTFTSGAALADNEVLEYIYNAVLDRLSQNKGHIIGLNGGIYDPVTIYTPRNNKITSAIKLIDDEFTATEANDSNNYWKSRYEKATFVSGSTRKYNCHSYAWYQQSSSNTVWLSNPGDDQFWNDGSYEYITSASDYSAIPNSAPGGTKISYPASTDHSAVVYSSSQFIAKWGSGPLMRHSPDHSPYSNSINYPKTLKYYRLATACPSINAWKGEYWNNKTLSGSPWLCRNDANVDFNWGSSYPQIGFPVDGFSARWTKVVSFSAGKYRFHLKGDDGIRLWVNGTLLINQWKDQPPTEYTADYILNSACYSVKVEYYENAVGAMVKLWWEKIASTPTVNSLAINNGSSSTTNRTVYLNNSCSGSPSHYMASESSSFTGASWLNYSSAPTFSLSSGSGTKTIYFKVKNSAGLISPVKTDTIYLNSVITYSCSPTPGIYTSYGNVIKLKVSSISGSKITFTVAKKDGTAFTSSGVMTIRVGAYNGCVANNNTYSWNYYAGNYSTSATFTLYFTSGTKYFYAAIGKPAMYCDSTPPTYYSGCLKVTAQ